MTKPAWQVFGANTAAEQVRAEMLEYREGARLRRYQGYRELNGRTEFLGFEEGWNLDGPSALVLFAEPFCGIKRRLRGNRVETRDGDVLKVVKV
jgi:hypothetical protein